MANSMARFTRALGALWLTGILAAVAHAPARAADRDTLYQYSTIDGLLAGLYDGDLTVGALTSHGDFGLGTFNGLDGEMIVVDGTVFQARGSGGIRVAPAATGIPFTSVTFFDADQTAPLLQGIDYDGLKALLDALAPNPNIYHAIRIDGRFRSMRLRVAPRQTEPYAPLADVIAQQAVFELNDVRGTLVGLRTPGYLAGLNVPGYHFHFVTEDRRRGGHVFGLITAEGSIAIDHTPGFTVALPHSQKFAALDLNKARGEEMRRVEQAQSAPTPSLNVATPVPPAPPAAVAPAQPVPAQVSPAQVSPARVSAEQPQTAKKTLGFFETLIECTDDALPAHMRLRNQRHKAAKRPSGKTSRCK